jgi:hypothetical protein
MIKTISFVIIGGVGGLAWQRFIGCRTGTCPITSNPYISTLYGAMMGLMLSGPG